MLADLNAAITLIETAVAADTITENAAAALLTLLGASSTAGVTDPATLARLSAISATINTNNAMLNAAVKVNTPTSTPSATTFSPSVTYVQGALVVFTDGMTYSSNASGNVGNTPSSTSTFWTVTSAPMIQAWVSTTTYNMNDKVLLDGVLYTSKIANNIGNLPSAVTTAWSAS